VTEEDVVKIVREFVDGQFPKNCSSCGRQFSSLKAYLQNTTQISTPISYDAELGDWRPKSPLGTFVLANCDCGSTLAISSSGMGIITFWRLMRWARRQIAKEGISITTLMVRVRSQIALQALSEPTVNGEAPH